MICKVAEVGVETHDLAWQSLGSGAPAGPTAKRVETAAASLALPSNPLSRPIPNASNGPDHPALAHLDMNGLRKRLAELENQRGAELEAARKSGFDEGVKQARREAAGEMEQGLNRLAQTIQELAQVKRKLRGEAENELVKLSLAIARRILHREVTADPQSLQGVVFAALQRLQNREITRIRVFPASVPAIKAALERNGGLAAIEIVGDGLLGPGGLLVETALGDLDASIETQLQEIDRGFADRLA